MIIDGVVGLHELVAHDPIVLTVSGSNLHVVGVEEKLAFACALVLHVGLSGQRELFSCCVLACGKDAELQGR